MRQTASVFLSLASFPVLSNELDFGASHYLDHPGADGRARRNIS